MLFVLIVYFILSLVIGSAASQRGRSAFGWFLVSILTTPLLAGVFLLLFPSLNDPTSVDDKALQEAIRRGRPVGPPRKLGAGGLTVSLTILLSTIIAAIVWNGNIIHFINELTAPSTNNAPTIIPSPLQKQTLVPRGSEKPSFDCATARTGAARLVCADADLARLDGELGAAFQKRKRQLPATEQPKFGADQLAWIRDRNTRCELVGEDKAPTDVLARFKQCVGNAIRERIAFLALAQTPTNTPMGWQQQTTSQSAALSQSELDALRTRISQCWNPPSGVSSTSYIVLHVLFNPDGSLARDPVVVEGASTSLAPELAGSAIRALLLCQPFTMLRSDHYDQWKDIEIKFDPHELLGNRR